MRKKHRGLLILMTVLLIITGYAVYQVKQVGSTLQYLIPAPAPQTDNQSGEEEGEKREKTPNQPIKEAYTRLKESAEDWQNIIAHYTLTGILEKASFMADTGDSVYARLNCLGPDAFSVYPQYVFSGRLFYPEELKNGRRAILLDQQLAIALFKTSDPVSRTVTLFGQEYEVIGILRHEKKVGDLEKYAAYIPLMQMVKEDAQLEALMVSAVPISGAGAKVAFQNTVTQWQPGGSMYDLGKEGMSATLWLRVLLFLAGATALFALIRFANRQVLAFIQRYKARLEHQFAVRLMPWLIGMCLLFALGYAILAGLAAVLMNFIIQPVYTFPEWIPTVLVEWADIESAFWNVWQSSATLLELRSPEILRLRFFAFLIQWCAAFMGVCLVVLCRRGPKLTKE